MNRFVIHGLESTDRRDIVLELQKRIGVKVIQACILTDGVRGCNLSHVRVAEAAKALAPSEHYFVFEDDCVLAPDFETTLENIPDVDIYYFGYNDKDFSSDLIYGTHALRLSPKARDILLTHAQELIDENIPFDHIIFSLSETYNLTRAWPDVSNKERWCYQKKGLKSIITHSYRE